MAERSWFTPIRGFVKLLALVVGGAVSLLALVAVLGAWIDSLLLRVVIGALVLVLLPLPLADRALPRDNPEGAKGIISDVIAIVWMSGALVVAALGPSLLHARLQHEATWLPIQGWPRAGWLARWLTADGAGPVVAPEPVKLATTPAEVAPAEPPLDKPEATTPDKPEDKPEAKPADSKPAEAKPEDKPADAEPADDKPAEPEAPKELTPAELFTAYAPAVVTIRNQGARGSSAGTGFFVDDKGLIATNHHVIAGAEVLTVKRFDGTETDKVEVVDQEPDVDLALLRIEPAEPVPPTTLGDSDAVTVGEAVVVIGNPLGLEHTLTDGLVSSRRLLHDKRYIQMSAPVSPGNSGGPVFNRRGEVIGVTVAKLMMGIGENLNLAIPVSELKALLARDHSKSKKLGSSSW